MRFFICLVLNLIFCFSAADAAPPAKDFGSLPAIYDSAISPDAKTLAVIINLNGKYAVRIMDIAGDTGKPRLIGLGEGVKPQWVKWVNNERVLISLWQSEKTNGTPYTTGFIYTLDTQKMKGKHLVKPKIGFFRQYNNTVVDFLEDDPDHILMSYSEVDVNAPDLRKVNVATGGSSRLRRGRANIQSWHTDLTGTPRISQGLKESSTKEEKWRMTILDLESDKWLDVENFPGLKAGADILGFTGNPNELIVRQRRNKNTSGLYIYDLSQKTFTRTLYHDDKYDAGSVILSGDGKRVIGTKFVSDAAETKLFDDEDTVLQSIRRDNPGFTVDYIDQSLNGEKIVFKMSNSYDPGRVFIVESKTLKLRSIGKIRPKLASNDMGEVISVKYKARDGFVIPAYVTIPPSITSTADLKNLPFIILPHGGPYARSSNRFDYFAQFFVTRGYGVLQMNFRGSAGYGKTYEDAGRENWVVMHEDVEDGARWLLSKGYADPNRMCIAGWSFGGYAALMGAVEGQDIYKCAMSMAGVTDLGDLIRDVKKYRFGELTANQSILSGFSDKSDLKTYSPTKRADEIKIPLFLAHGKTDQRVHFDQYTRMKRALKKSPAQVTYMEFKDEDHYLSNQSNREKFFVGLEKFLLSVNGPSEYAAP